jgi:DNA-directed RNA polymerase I subunit RPA2
MERDALIAHGTSFLLQDRLMNCSDYSTAWVCRTCGSIISLGYDNVGLGSTVLGAESLSKPTGPGGEYCRICRAVAEEEDKLARQSLANGTSEKPTVSGDVRVSIPSANFLGSTLKGGDLDVVAVPYVFRYLCAELAAMGIAVSVAVE